MIPLPTGVRVWIAAGPTDMRRGMPELGSPSAGGGLKRDPHAGDLYVFRGKSAQTPTFCIPFSFCEDRLPLASVVWTDIAGLAVSPR